MTALSGSPGYSRFSGFRLRREGMGDEEHMRIKLTARSREGAEHYGSPVSTWFALMPWACGSILEGLNGEAWENEP